MLSKHLTILVVLSELVLLLGFTGCETNRRIEMKRSAALEAEKQRAEAERRDKEAEEKAQQSVKEQTEAPAPELIGWHWVDDYPTFYLTFRQVPRATEYVIEISTGASPKWRRLAVFIPSPLLPEHEATYSRRGIIPGVGIRPFYVRVRGRNSSGVGPASAIGSIPPPPVG